MGNMGLNTSKSSMLDACLLSNEELKRLNVGDRFDHRDQFGQFAKAKILQKSKNKFWIHYEGYASNWDTWCDYKNDPYSFARYKSVTSRNASRLRDIKLNDWVNFNPRPQDSNCPWRKGEIIQFDSRGQVKVAYKNRNNQRKEMWTHLDNEYEIKYLSGTQQQQRQNRGSYTTHHSHNNYNNYNNNNCNQYNQYHQSQKQSLMKKQDQMTVRTQLLLDDTRNQIEMTKEYLDHFNLRDCSSKQLSLYNQKVVGGLTLFKMKVDAMRKNGKKQNLDFSDAFKSSSMLIKQFEIDYKNEFGSNKLLMQRLEPCLNYMRAVLIGQNNVPPLPYLNEYKFNKEIASSVMSGVAHSMNHVLPDRMKEISTNNNKYKSYQKHLKQQYEDEQHQENVSNNIDFNHLIQDFSSNNIAFAKSKKEQDEINRRESIKFAHKEPDLQNMDIDDE